MRVYARNYTRGNIEPFEARNEQADAVNSLNFIYFKILLTHDHHSRIFSLALRTFLYIEKWNIAEIRLTSQPRWLLRYSDKSFTVKLSSSSWCTYSITMNYPEPLNTNYEHFLPRNLKMMQTISLRIADNIGNEC